MKGFDNITYDDFLTFAKRMKSVYPQSVFIPTQASITEWYNALREYNAKELNRAFEMYTKVNDTPPSVTEIRNIIETFTKADEFDPDAFWEEYDYWVLTDLDGNFINEFVVKRPCSSDEMRAWLSSKRVPLEGTILRPYANGIYKPKYKRGGGGTKVSLEDVQKAFKGIEVEVQ